LVMLASKETVDRGALKMLYRGALPNVLGGK